MAGGVNRNSFGARREADIARAIAQPMEIEYVGAQLMKVTGSTQIDATNKRWSYTVRRAQVGPGGSYTPTVTSNSAAEPAVSVSELSNGTHVSYGVVRANIPVGFNPVAIPTNTYVLCVPSRTTLGTLLWLIVNTQAIDGTCAQLVGDLDFGSFETSGADADFGTFDAPTGSADFGAY